MRAIGAGGLLFLLVGCADPVDQGLSAYHAGNCDLAVQFWNPAALAGNPLAQNNLAVVWETGCGSTIQNRVHALNWYMRAARGGYVPSMVAAGKMLRQAGNEADAMSWFVLAARWGNEEARGLVAIAGHPVPPPDLLQQSIAADAPNPAMEEAMFGMGRTIGYGLARAASR